MCTLLPSTWPTMRSPMRSPITSPEREDGRAAGVEVGHQTALAQARQHAFAEPVRLFEVGVAGEDELVEAELGVLDDAVGDLVVRPDERGADAAAHETDAGPHVGMHREPFGVAAVELGHAPLPDRLGRGE